MAIRRNLPVIWTGLSIALLLMGATPSWAKKAPLKAHVHGTGKLDVATQGENLSLDLDVPAGDIFGFEHSPRTPSEKQKVDASIAQLRNQPLALFGLRPELACKVAKAEVTPHYDDHHAEIEASFHITCVKPLKGERMTLPLFKTFPGIKSLQVQVLTESGQRGQKVASAAEEIGL